MRPRPVACDPERLRQLLETGISDPRHAELIEHLDVCGDCRSSLEQLAAGEHWWEDARQFVKKGVISGSGFAVPLRDQEDSTGCQSEASSDLEESFNLLTPSTSPGSLGRLGPYEVLDILGRGGMGVVFRAHDPALNRPVAIKVLARNSGMGTIARRRFAREARAAAAVVHEHVVAIHAVEEAAGSPYLVMQYVAGRSLQQRIDRDGPLRVEEVLRIGMQVASGLAAAHAQGLIHRDVKPANILLENGVERVKLTDFGLARAVDDSSLTHSGVVAGTPQYMSPEQARGQPVDCRSDIFSLGSVLYAMCVGRSPFRAESTPVVLRRICDEEPRPIRQINPDVPSWLEAIVAKLHEKEPSGRYQTATEVAEVLAGHLARLQEPGRKPIRSAFGDDPISVKPWRKPRNAALAFIGLAICGVSAVVGLSRLSLTDRAPSRPVDATSMPPLAFEQRFTPHGLPRTIAGFVRDRESSKPIPGVRLVLVGQAVSTTSDSDGRFELRGRANVQPLEPNGASRFEVSVEPIGLPFLAMNVAIVGDEDKDPIHVEIPLSPGIPFRLKLTDRASGGPVRSAQVTYRPIHPNAFVGEILPPGGNYPSCRASEGPDGTYSGVVIAGPGAIYVENFVEYYGGVSVDPISFFVPGASATNGMDASTLYGTSRLLAFEINGTGSIHYQPQDGMSGLLLINPKPGSAPIELELALRKNRRPDPAP